MSYRHFLLVFLLLFTVSGLHAVDARQNDDGPIVIVSSYNPDVKRISDNIEAFSREYTAKGGKHEIKVENMNCRNLSEAYEWESRLTLLLEKYYAKGGHPSVIVLLGIEASTAFFSIDVETMKNTPVIIGTRGNNIVELPNDMTSDVSKWEPEVRYLTRDFGGYNIVGGEVYDYDIEKNIDLLKHLYPQRKHVVLLSDNTLGGVTMRAHFMKQMAQHDELKSEFLDGRTMSFLDVSSFISKLDENDAIFIGTWRIDNSETYTLENTIVALASANKRVPAFSLTNTGMGLWAVGGYAPEYDLEGAKLADAVYAFETTGRPQPLSLVKNVYQFDHTKLNHFGIDRDQLPSGSRFLNEPQSFFEQYQTTVIIVICIIIFLSFALSISLYLLRLSHHLQHETERYSREMEEARDKAEEANRMKSAFIANISHEIRTPLNAVVGFSQLLTDPEMPLEDEERREFGNYIKMNSDTLLNLVNDILDISKMDAGRMVFNFAEADLVEICHAAAESAKTNVAPGVEILTALPGEKLMIKTDVLRLQQVFNNLFTNAKKFTDKGSITLSIDKVDVVKKVVTLSVTDTGTGIPADKAEFVFERFKQLDSFKPGTGLGLSITRSIITTLGGRIWLDTSYTSGARFCFTHPLI